MWMENWIFFFLFSFTVNMPGISLVPFSTGPLSDLRYRQVRLDFGVHCAHARPPGAIAADYSRLPSATPGHHRRQRYQIMVVQALTEQIPEPIVFWFVIFGFVAKCVIHCIWDYYMYGSLRLYVRRNARFFHLYENLKLQDRLISLTH